MTTFSKKEAIKYGWETFKANWKILVGVTIFLFIASSLFDVALQFIGEEDLLAIFSITTLGTLIEWFIYLGLLGMVLKIYDKKETSFSELFSQMDVFFNYIIGTILYLLIILGGLILLIVPGIIWSIKYHYYVYLIVDKKMSPTDAIKESGRMTLGHKWNIFVFFILVGLLNILGVLLLGVGLLITVPVTILASVWVYRWLEFNSQAIAEPVETEIAPIEETPEETKPE